MTPPRTAAILALTGAMLAATTHAQRAADPLVKEGTTVKVAAHTYVIPDDNVPLVPNVGIIVGTRATLVIDPGLGRRNGETVVREVAKVSRNTELYVATTHFHVEHTTGVVAFPPTAKYINPKVQEEEYAAESAREIEQFSRRSPATAELLKGAALHKTDISFDRDYALDLGGVRVRFTVVGPAHTRGDTAIFVQGDDVLFSGDVAMNQSFLAAGAEASMKGWLAAFDLFDSMHPKLVVPSHGPIGDGGIVTGDRAVMLAVQTRTRELKAQGRSIDETARTVQMEIQAQHPTWPRANGLLNASRAAYREAP